MSGNKVTRCGAVLNNNQFPVSKKKYNKIKNPRPPANTADALTYALSY